MNPSEASRLDGTEVLRREIDEIVAQISHAVDAKFDYRIDLDFQDHSIDKLKLLINFFLESAQTFLREHERKNQVLEKEILALSGSKEVLQATLQAGDAAYKNKSLFLADITERIRQPLREILDAAGRLAKLPGADGSLIQGARERSDVLFKIINDINDLSKIEAGDLEVEHVPCSQIELLASIEEMLRPQVSEKGLRLQIVYESEVPEVILSDPTRLGQVLTNLIGNAVRFTEEGGVRIGVRFLPDGSSEPCLRFEISDSGSGITAEQLGQLFQPFAHDDNPFLGRQGDSGLGLVISQLLISLLGGEMNVTTTPGLGASVRLQIPTGPVDDVKFVDAVEYLRTPKESREAGETGAGEAGESKLEPPPPLDCRILVADDDEKNRENIYEILSDAGARVSLAENGRVALEMISKAEAEGHPFDVLFLDLQMPEVSGLEATKTLRDKGSKTPIVALTDKAMRSEREESLDVGCDAFATKPYDRMSLVLLVQSSLAKREDESEDEDD